MIWVATCSAWKWAKTPAMPRPIVGATTSPIPQTLSNSGETIDGRSTSM